MEKKARFSFWGFQLCEWWWGFGGDDDVSYALEKVLEGNMNGKGGK